MRLLIATPGAVIVDHHDILAVRAEDDSGSFGILSGHTEFLTALAVSVVSWRHRDGHESHCAVRGGVLTVRGGKEVFISTREAFRSDDLYHLEQVVRTEFREAYEAELAARSHAAQLHLKAVRHILRFLRPERRSMMDGAE